MLLAALKTTEEEEEIEARGCLAAAKPISVDAALLAVIASGIVGQPVISCIKKKTKN